MEAKELFEDGVKCFSDGLYEEALDLFGKISHHDTDPEGIYVDLAVAFSTECYKLTTIKLISQGRPKEATAVINRALDHVPGHPEFEFFRGIAANNALNFPVAIRNFEGLLAKDPANISLITCLCISLLNIGNLERVEQLMGKILKLNADLFHLRAIARFRVKKVSEAADLLNRAVAEKTPFEEAQTKRAGAFLIQREYEAAQREIEAVLPTARERKTFLVPLAFLRNHAELVSQHPVVREMLVTGGDCSPNENEVRRWVDSLFHRTLTIDVLAVPFQGERGSLLRNDWFRGLLVQHYEQMVLKGVDLPELYFRLGREFQRLNQFDRSQEYFQKCLEKAPRFVPAKISLAFLYKDRNEDDEAIRLFEEIRSDFQQMPGMIMHSGESIFDENAYKGKENHLRAELQVLLAAVEKNPGFADMYYSIGRIYYLLEDPEQALGFFDKASLINPHFIRANIGKAVTLMQLNHTDQAREILNGLSSNNTLYGKITFNLALLRLRSGDKARARDLLQEISTLEGEYGAQARELLEQPGFP